MENVNCLKLKRHETFSIRNSWLEKGINVVKENPLCFRKDDATRLFGIGSNMVKSLKYWLMATKLVEFGQNFGAKLTDFGECIYKYDRYIEDLFSWWMIHYFLSTNFHDSPVINDIFNNTINKFDKEKITLEVRKDFEKKGYKIGAESSLDSDISVALRTYYAENKCNPEDSTECPLGKLKLLELSDSQKYNKTHPQINSLDYRVIYYCILNCIKNNSINLSCNLEDLYTYENNPLKIFNLSKSSLFNYLDDMNRNGLIHLIKTAGLNTLYIEKEISIYDLFESYYKEKR